MYLDHLYASDEPADEEAPVWVNKRNSGASCVALFIAPGLRQVLDHILATFASDDPDEDAYLLHNGLRRENILANVKRKITEIVTGRVPPKFRSETRAIIPSCSGRVGTNRQIHCRFRHQATQISSPAGKIYIGLAAYNSGKLAIRRRPRLFLNMWPRKVKRRADARHAKCRRDAAVYGDWRLLHKA